MQMKSQSLWRPRLITSSVASLAAASGVYWMLQWPQNHGTSVAPVVAVMDAAPGDVQALSRMLGGTIAAVSDAPVANVASRFVLIGVLADARHGGTALIATDGQRAKPYKVGSRVDGELVLESVAPSRAVLAAGLGGPASLTLEMKPPGK